MYSTIIHRLLYLHLRFPKLGKTNQRRSSQAEVARANFRFSKVSFRSHAFRQLIRCV